MSNNLTCPIPDTLNPLYISNFVFSVHKLPSMTFFVQQASLPDITLGEATMATPLVDFPIPGDKMNFSQFSCTFMIDEKFENYKNVTEWIMALGYPDNHERYTQFINKQESNLNEHLKTVSDATLGVLDANLRAIATYTFIDCFPISVSGIQYDTTVADAVPIKATVTFAYSHYELKTL